MTQIETVAIGDVIDKYGEVIDLIRMNKNNYLLFIEKENGKWCFARLSTKAKWGLDFPFVHYADSTQAKTNWLEYKKIYTRTGNYAYR